MLYIVIFIIVQPNGTKLGNMIFEIQTLIKMILLGKKIVMVVTGVN